MSEFTVGKFTFRVGGPYPCWVRIEVDGREVCSVRHEELSDLAYAVERAMRDARVLLKKDAGEV